MEILNDSGLAPAYMVGSVRSKGPTLTFLVKGAFSLAPGSVAEALEEPAFPHGDKFYEDDPEEQGAPRYSSDFVPFKPAADLLVVGSCWAPRRGEKQCVARVRCGRVQASLLVTGDREWSSGLLGGSASEAEAFERIELRYENSYGGEGFAANPRGKGAAAIEVDGRKRRPMPNLMDPERPVASLRGKHEPVGFGPTSAHWEPRSGMLGTFDDAWLEKRWPWLPEDVDWRYFNAAPEALQIQGYLHGDEEVSLENLHPEHRTYDFRLPGIQPRLFVDDRERGYGEVPLELDTCWVDMDAEQLVLIWRGVRPVADEFFDELVGLHLVQESMADEPGDVARYERKYREGDRKPAPPPAEGPTPAERLAEKRARAEAEQAKALSAAGVEIPAPRERTEEELADEARLLEIYGVKLPEAAPEFTRGDVEALARAGESLAGRDLTGLELDGIDLSGADLKGALLRGVPLEGANLSGADLSDAVLVQCSLRGAVLTGCRLDGADLADACLDGADLSEASLARTSCSRASMRAVRMDRCQGAAAIFADCTLDECSALDADFSDADFSTASLEGARLLRATLVEARFNGVRARGSDFRGACLRQAQFSDGANLSHGIFRRTEAADSIWDGAQLQEADFAYAQLPGAALSKAQMEGAGLYAVEMRGACLTQSSLKGADIRETNLFEAALDHADLRDADLRGANLYGAETYASRFEGTRFEGANLQNTKLAGGRR